MRIIVCNNRYNRSLPSKNRTLYFTLFHLFLLLLLLSQLYTLFHVTHYDTESNNTNMQCAGMAVAPRVSCCRREEDATLARAVNDNDLVLWGSAHGVPRDVGCRRWQSMPVLESNSLEQWAQRYPNACGALRLTAVAWLAGRIMQVIDKFRLCRGTPLIYCVNGGYSHLAPATPSTTVRKKVHTGIWRTIARVGSFAHLFVCHGRCRIPSLRKKKKKSW